MTWILVPGWGTEACWPILTFFFLAVVEVGRRVSLSARPMESVEDSATMKLTYTYGGIRQK